MAKMAKPGTYIKYGKTAKPIPLYTEGDVRSIFDDLVWNSVGKDATKKVADFLWDDVFQDVKECSGFPRNLNYDDVRLAFGRVLIKRLGVEND